MSECQEGPRVKVRPLFLSVAFCQNFSIITI
nr:MAG TPA: hypothetical protein [Caudoviricetes sp.]